MGFKRRNLGRLFLPEAKARRGRGSKFSEEIGGD
jgi:hypothetical protein